MTSRPASQCIACQHFRSPLDGAPEQTCDAFPAGIPDDVWWNRTDHRQPIAGDHDIRWASNGKPFPEWALRSQPIATLRISVDAPPAGPPSRINLLEAQLIAAEPDPPVGRAVAEVAAMVVEPPRPPDKDNDTTRRAEGGTG